MPNEFAYHAAAYGVAARITNPIQELIETQAGVNLSIIGGVAAKRRGPFRFREILSYRSAHARVSGTESAKPGRDPHFATLATSVIEGLNILDMITADRVVAQLSSEHDAEGGPPRIIPIGSHFENLRIGGCPIAVELDIDTHCQFSTFDAFRQNDAASRQNDGRDTSNLIYCSLVKSIESQSCAGVEIEGNVIKVPQFGTVYLGELLIQPDSKRLTMIRVELGCPTDGRVAAGGAETNGVHY